MVLLCYNPDMMYSTHDDYGEGVKTDEEVSATGGKLSSQQSAFPVDNYVTVF
jgi:hypothetical protein